MNFAETLQDILILKDTLNTPVAPLPVRSVVIKLTGGAVLISPIPNINAQKNKIDNFAHITDIVAPNLFHHLGVRPAMTFFPTAQVWCAPGLPEKRKNLELPNILGKTPWPYENELPLFLISGSPKFNECVFLHRKSKTLIVQDLCFNLKGQKSFGAKVVFGLMGTLNQFAISRLLRFLIKDKTAFAQSVRQLLAEDFDNIIMAHGEIVIGNAKELLRKALHQRGIQI